MSTSSARLEIVVNISDVLNIIPTYPGATGEVDFMYFREACRNALAVVGPRYERLLLIFLKTKLTDDAYMRFALRLPNYEKLSQFLLDAKHVYAPDCDEPSFWNMKMFAMRQKSESTPKFAAKFQELISCATIATRHEEMLRAFLATQESLERQKKNEAAKKVQKQDSAGSEGSTKRRLNLEEVMELLNAVTQDENPKIETPVSPEPKIRAEKTLSIKGADYPQLEYPTVHPATGAYKKYDRDFKYEYKKDADDYKKYDRDLKYQYEKDDDDIKYELNPKTIAGKNS